MLILDKLITLTIEEVKMYPSVQAKIWGTIGKMTPCYGPIPFKELVVSVIQENFINEL